MFRNNRLMRFAFSTAVICSAAVQSFQVSGQDLVASETLSGGGSAFVFREPVKKPQGKMAGGFAYLGGEGSTRGRRPHVNSQIASAAQKRRAAAASRRRAAQAAANRKIQLSNTLTAKAEADLDKDQIDLA